MGFSSGPERALEDAVTLFSHECTFQTLFFSYLSVFGFSLRAEGVAARVVTSSGMSDEGLFSPFQLWNFCNEMSGVFTVG